MKHTTLCMLAMSLLTVSLARADVTIVANLGPHASAAAAGNSEEQTDWLDADSRDDTICTEAFAAVELQRVLRKATGRDADFVIVDANGFPLILRLSRSFALPKAPNSRTRVVSHRLKAASSS